jgi:hypothetical protein
MPGYRPADDCHADHLSLTGNTYAEKTAGCRLVMPMQSLDQGIGLPQSDRHNL